MMVPRAFLFTSLPPQKAMMPIDVKDQPGVVPKYRPGSQTTYDGKSRGPSNAIPVGIPSKWPSHVPVQRETRSRIQSKSRPSSHRSSSASSNDHHIPTTVASVLDATAIPLPRRSWKPRTRKSRKLPRGNHVEEFCRFLQEGVDSKEDYLTAGAGNSAMEILLSPPDYSDKYMVHDSEPEPSLSARSSSSDSMPSLSHDLASPSSISQPPTPASHKSPSERRQLRYSPAMDCVFDHPLLETEIEEGEYIDFNTYDKPEMPDVIPEKRSSTLRSFPSLRSSFKSNLTASLRAIKSAAQSVSTFATPSVQPEDFLTRSLFSITPELTDDRRPLPMQTPPSPELRRYLNPTSLSPAEMCVYHDHPHDTPESTQACVSIQMQTYRRSRNRGHRRNHFHVVPKKNRDQAYTFDPEVAPMSRQREPRENSDFLRMVVLEMNMRRSGKLREDIPTRARIWLPPRNSNPYRLYGDYEDCEDNNTIPSRWVGVSA
ncbi:hypothetical protein N7478_004789 [Penicillium angulare]|uniref:uncharacterized protein n=1 Tax=Penicillium angulare TaxID=116970 RepID=UPI002541C919|nr:uncharacterized protein N7478_004789 [Penicillium angulare]KAJ5279417.1 hypothetical protein N7478_004789 [Penicillium angulare]